MDGAGRKADGVKPDPQELARDWIALWQSELAALAADRETQEMWRTWLSVWAGMAAAAMRSLPRGGDDGFDAGRGRAAAAPRAAAAAAAPDPRDAEIERLARHIGELEQRLAALERRG